MAHFGKKIAARADLENSDELIGSVQKSASDNKSDRDSLVSPRGLTRGRRIGHLPVPVLGMTRAKRGVRDQKRQREAHEIARAPEINEARFGRSDGKRSVKLVRLGKNAPRKVTSAQEKLILIILDKVSGAKLASTIELGKSLEDVANRMVASLPETNDLDAAVGPFYDTAGLARWLGINKEAIASRVSSRNILGVQSSDGHWIYPAFQFTDKGEPLPRLREVVDAINPDTTDAWGTAIWLNHSMSKLGGRTPAEALRTDLADTVVATAGRIKSALAS